MTRLTTLYTRLLTLLTGGDPPDDNGFVTAEHLGVAALGIGALVVIVAAMQTLGVDVVNWIRGQLGV